MVNEDRCGKCGKVLSREYTSPERKPCPYCGSIARNFIREFTQSIGFKESMKTKIDKIRGIGRKAEFIIETDSTHEIEKITVKSTDEKNKPITVEFSKKKEENEGKTGSKITQELARYPCHYCGMLFDDYERRQEHERNCPKRPKR